MEAIKHDQEKGVFINCLKKSSVSYQEICIIDTVLIITLCRTKLQQQFA